MKLYQIIDRDWDEILKWSFENMKEQKRKAVKQGFIKFKDWRIICINE